MSVEQLSTNAPQGNAERSHGTRFPAYNLASCIEVARLIHINGGGQASPEHLAHYLGYKGTNNGAYLSKVGAARLFGLISKSGNVFVPTPLAHTILSPTYQHDAKKALVDAFFNVELFKQIYEDFKGKELPPEFGMKNALRHTYSVAPTRLDEAYKSLIDSSETAGFFETKLGAKTHLILPAFHAPQKPGSAQQQNADASTELGGRGDGGGNEGGGGPPPPPPSTSPFASAAIGDVKAKYLSALITLFETKSAKGELDEKLMERIERLLGEGKPGGTP